MNKGNENQNLGGVAAESPRPAPRRFVIVETERGTEVWPNAIASKIVAIFTHRIDAELFVEYCSRSDTDRIHNAALEIARAFPDLNYSNAPINPHGELVQRIARIIAADFPVAKFNEPERDTETVQVA